MQKGSSLYNEDTIQISIRFPESMMEKIKAEATRKHLSINQEVIHLIQVGLQCIEKDQEKLNA